MAADPDYSDLRKLTWSPEAKRQLISIAAYYDQFDRALADAILQRVEEAPASLLAFPGIGSPAAEGTRKWRVPHTPYLLFYDSSDTAVEIVSVRHARSDYPR